MTRRWVLASSLGLAVGIPAGIALGAPLEVIVGAMVVTPLMMGLSSITARALQPPWRRRDHRGPHGLVQPRCPSGMIRAELYLLCPDLGDAMAELRQRGTECEEPIEAGWGLLTHVHLPSGRKLGLYEPRHPTALAL